jgi:hypothetical protein
VNQKEILSKNNLIDLNILSLFYAFTIKIFLFPLQESNDKPFQVIHLDLNNEDSLNGCAALINHDLYFMTENSVGGNPKLFVIRL